MARKFLTPIDLNKLELQNAAIQNLATDPASPAVGQVYYNTSAGRLKIKNASAFVEVPTSGTIVNADISASAAIAYSKLSLAGAILNSDLAGSISNDKLATNPLARANHTGTQTASTISDFDTQVRTNRLDQLAAPTAAVSLNSQKITNLAEPTAASDAATKNYVDNAVVGIDWKPSVRAIATANITLSATQTVDGVALVVGDRVLVAGQTTGANNGIYVVASGAWTRASDLAAGSSQNGFAVFVEEGTNYADTGWVCTNNGAITIGTTALTFTQFSGGGSIIAGDGLTQSGNTFNVGAGTGITVNADSVQISATYAGQNTITTLGTVTTGVWNATAIGAGYGGTGLSTYAVGDLIYASGATTLSKLAAVATGNVLISGGVTTAPSWGKVGLTTHVSGTLAVGNGGTGATTLTSNGVLLGNGTSAVSATTAGTADQVLRVPGAGGAPAFGAIDLSKSAAVTGALAIANGGTGQTTKTAAFDALSPLSTNGDILYHDGTDNVRLAGNATATKKFLTQTGTGSASAAPAWDVLAAADIPAAAKALRYSADVGDNTSTSIAVTHSLGTLDVVVNVYEKSSGATVECDISRTSTSVVTLGFGVAPAAGSLRVVVIG